MNERNLLYVQGFYIYILMEFFFFKETFSFNFTLLAVNFVSGHHADKITLLFFWSMKCCTAPVDVFCFAKFIMFSIIATQLPTVKASSIHSELSCMLTKIFNNSILTVSVYIFLTYCHTLASNAPKHTATLVTSNGYKSYGFCYLIVVNNRHILRQVCH